MNCKREIANNARRDNFPNNMFTYLRKNKITQKQFCSIILVGHVFFFGINSSTQEGKNNGDYHCASSINTEDLDSMNSFHSTDMNP